MSQKMYWILAIAMMCGCRSAPQETMPSARENQSTEPFVEAYNGKSWGNYAPYVPDGCDQRLWVVVRDRLEGVLFKDGEFRRVQSEVAGNAWSYPHPSVHGNVVEDTDNTTTTAVSFDGYLATPASVIADRATVDEVRQWAINTRMDGCVRDGFIAFADYADAQLDKAERIREDAARAEQAERERQSKVPTPELAR